MEIRKSVVTNYELFAKAEAFIVPNSASPAKNFVGFMPDKFRHYAELNGLSYDENDKMVELWITSSELRTENLGGPWFYVF